MTYNKNELPQYDCEKFYGCYMNSHGFVFKMKQTLTRKDCEAKLEEMKKVVPRLNDYRVFGNLAIYFYVRRKWDEDSEDED